MVCEGHAWWYKRYAPTNRELSSCQGYAIENKLGLWKGYEPIPPWEFRRGVRGKTTRRAGVIKPSDDA